MLGQRKKTAKSRPFIGRKENTKKTQSPAVSKNNQMCFYYSLRGLHATLHAPNGCVDFLHSGMSHISEDGTGESEVRGDLNEPSTNCQSHHIDQGHSPTNSSGQKFGIYVSAYLVLPSKGQGDIS